MTVSTKPGETRGEWDRRMRDGLKVPDDLDPLTGTIVITHESVQQESDARGRRQATPRTIEFDVLADKRSLRPVAYRFADGTIQHIGGSSGASDRVIAVESVPRRKQSDPGAKSPARIVQRFTVEPTRETVIDDDGTERVVVGRRPRVY